MKQSSRSPTCMEFEVFTPDAFSTGTEKASLSGSSSNSAGSYHLNTAGKWHTPNELTQYNNVHQQLKKRLRNSQWYTMDALVLWNIHSSKSSVKIWRRDRGVARGTTHWTPGRATRRAMKLRESNSNPNRSVRNACHNSDCVYPLASRFNHYTMYYFEAYTVWTLPTVELKRTRHHHLQTESALP